MLSLPCGMSKEFCYWLGQLKVGVSGEWHNLPAGVPYTNKQRGGHQFVVFLAHWDMGSHPTCNARAPSRGPWSQGWLI